MSGQQRKRALTLDPRQTLHHGLAVLREARDAAQCGAATHGAGAAVPSCGAGLDERHRVVTVVAVDITDVTARDTRGARRSAAGAEAASPSSSATGAVEGAVEGVIEAGLDERLRVAARDAVRAFMR